MTQEQEHFNLAGPGGLLIPGQEELGCNMGWRHTHPWWAEQGREHTGSLSLLLRDPVTKEGRFQDSRRDGRTLKALPVAGTTSPTHSAVRTCPAGWGCEVQVREAS